MSKQNQLDAFIRQDVSYKQLASHDFQASILVSKHVLQGTYPLIVRWHGGGLVNGHRLYTQWLPPYILTHAQRSQAIVVLPDYRLLPGVSSALDILQDIKDFFVWLFEGGLNAHLPTGICVNLDDVLVSGESAGGWLAIQSGFILGPSKIKAVIAQYPMIDMRDEHWSAKVKGKYLQGSPTVEPKVLEKILSADNERIVTNRIPPEGGKLYIGLVQQGRYTELFGQDKCLYPLELLEDNRQLPPLWIIHGTGDTIVPPRGSIKFAYELRENHDSPVHFTLRPGEEHLFDTEIGTDQDWVQNGLGFIGKYWPAGGLDICGTLCT